MGGLSQPGLRPQHLNGITAVAQMYNGLLLGAVVNSCEIEYRPRKFMPGVLTVDIKTAGTQCACRSI
jgi:RNA 3'-terminal phosphate cyclase